MMNILEAWRSGKTVRKHTMHTLRRENTAEHTWGASFLVLRYAPYARARLMAAVVTHDMGEQATCDAPAMLFWDFPDMKAAFDAKEQEHVAACLNAPEDEDPESFHNSPPLTWEEEIFVEVADRAEFILGCVYDYLLGNKLMDRPIVRAMRRLSEIIQKLPDESRWMKSSRYLMQDLRALLNKEGLEDGSLR